MALLGTRRSTGASIDAGLADAPIARLERAGRGLRLIVDGGHDELRIGLPTGEEQAVLDRLRADLAAMREEAT